MIHPIKTPREQAKVACVLYVVCNVLNDNNEPLNESMYIIFMPTAVKSKSLYCRYSLGILAAFRLMDTQVAPAA